MKNFLTLVGVFIVFSLMHPLLGLVMTYFAIGWVYND